MRKADHERHIALANLIRRRKDANRQGSVNKKVPRKKNAAKAQIIRETEGHTGLGRVIRITASWPEQDLTKPHKAPRFG